MHRKLKAWMDYEKVSSKNAVDGKGVWRCCRRCVSLYGGKGSKRYYIQSAYAVPNQAKMKQEQRSQMLTGDFFKKIIITKDAPAPYYNDDGVLVMSAYDFLLNENSLDN